MTTREKQWRDCLLNTCVRFARDVYPELSLTNCLSSPDFAQQAQRWLGLSFFWPPIEWEMESARKALIIELSRL